MYKDAIKTILVSNHRIGYDPRHIEAYMRLQYGTLDHLDATTFRREVEISRKCIDFEGKDIAEQLAVSYGI